MIETRACPWKAGKNDRKGKVRLRRQTGGYQTWKNWSGGMKMALMIPARMAIGHPTILPVDLDVLFVMDDRGNPPDRTNLLKSFEDILQGIVYVNDIQVEGGDSRRVFIGDEMAGRRGVTWEGPERIHFRVTSLG